MRFCEELPTVASVYKMIDSGLAPDPLVVARQTFYLPKELSTEPAYIFPMYVDLLAWQGSGGIRWAIGSDLVIYADTCFDVNKFQENLNDSLLVGLVTTPFEFEETWCSGNKQTLVANLLMPHYFDISDYFFRCPIPTRSAISYMDIRHNLEAARNEDTSQTLANSLYGTTQEITNEITAINNILSRTASPYSNYPWKPTYECPYPPYTLASWLVQKKDTNGEKTYDSLASYLDTSMSLEDIDDNTFEDVWQFSASVFHKLFTQLALSRGYGKHNVGNKSWAINPN